MRLQDRLLEDAKDAMRKGDKLRRSVLSYLRSAIHNEEITKREPLSDDEVLTVIGRQTKQRKESIAEYRRGNRPDLMAQEEVELAVLQEYLPEQMSEEEIARLARQAIEETGAQDPKEKGKVMGRLMPQVRGKADGTQVNAIVTQLLEEMGRN